MNKKHTVNQCTALTKLNVQDRIASVKEKKLCSNCLRKNHLSKECRQKTSCKVCRKNHHTLLHFDHQKKTAMCVTVYDDKAQQLSVFHVNKTTDVLLATALVAVLNKKGDKVLLRALIDQGSQSAFLTENAAQLLALPRKKIDVEIDGIGIAKTNATSCIELCVFATLWWCFCFVC